MLVAAGALACSAGGLRAGLADARVMADETITTSPAWNSGASPMWCTGAPLLVRRDGVVWASISIRDPDAPPYCNTHWELWRRAPDRPWEKVRQGPEATEREPCPISLVNPESLAVSIQPKVLFRDKDHQGELGWYCQPGMLAFDPDHIDREIRMWTPVFSPGAPFAQHSYRSLGVDAAAGEMLLLVIGRDDIYRPTWRDAAGRWHPLGTLTFPVRGCYPEIVLRNRAGYVFAIGDIKEPNTAWKAEKFRVLQREWDYAFRRLFFTWTPDVAAEGFKPPLEIDSVDDTAGFARNLDMLVDSQRRVHLLWVRRTIEYDFLRDRFFPGRPITETVMYGVIEDGRVVARQTLRTRDAIRDSRPAPTGRAAFFTSGRLHALPDGRLLAVLRTEADAPEAPGRPALFLQELDPQTKSIVPPVEVPLGRSFPDGWFFTNTPRGGSAPSHELDILGAETTGNQIKLRYLHVHLP